jgi:hypothetical protein
VRLPAANSDLRGCGRARTTADLPFVLMYLRSECLISFEGYQPAECGMSINFKQRDNPDGYGPPVTNWLHLWQTRGRISKHGPGISPRRLLPLAQVECLGKACRNAGKCISGQKMRALHDETFGAPLSPSVEKTRLAGHRMSSSGARNR